VVGACAPPNASDTEGEAEDGSGEESEPFTPIPVEVALVAPADLHRVVSGSTTLSSALQVAAVAELAGSVREVSVEGGDSVTVGQVLARVVNDDVRISIDEARQAVERNEREVERLRPLFDRGFLAAQTFETAEYQLETAQTGLHRLRTQGATQTVRAPIDGVITRREVEAGAVVVPNQVLFEITVIDSLEARIAVPERELGQLRVGQAAVLTAEAFPDQTFVGSVTRIDPIVNPRTGTVAVRVSLEQITGAEGALLRPGMFSGVRIVTDTRDAVASVPKRALVREAGVHYVFEIGDVVERPPFEGSGEPTGLQLLTPFEVRRVEVTLGYENRDRVQVDELDVGSRVIVVGQAGLDADSVVVIPFDGDPAND
jgi:RND family efflux transporter MFP subunit